jgi:hypothetical protein
MFSTIIQWLVLGTAIYIVAQFIIDHLRRKYKL